MLECVCVCNVMMPVLLNTIYRILQEQQPSTYATFAHTHIHTLVYRVFGRRMCVLMFSVLLDIFGFLRDWYRHETA